MIDPTGGASTTGQNDPSIVYDGGVSRPIVATHGNATLNATTANMVPAAAGLRTKVLSVNIHCLTFTTAGAVALQDPTVRYRAMWIAAVGNQLVAQNGGVMLFATGVNAALDIFYAGNANISWSIAYYQAP